MRKARTSLLQLGLGREAKDDDDDTPDYEDTKNFGEVTGSRRIFMVCLHETEASTRKNEKSPESLIEIDHVVGICP